MTTDRTTFRARPHEPETIGTLAQIVLERYAMVARRRAQLANKPRSTRPSVRVLSADNPPPIRSRR